MTFPKVWLLLEEVGMNHIEVTSPPLPPLSYMKLRYYWAIWHPVLVQLAAPFIMETVAKMSKKLGGTSWIPTIQVLTLILKNYQFPVENPLHIPAHSYMMDNRLVFASFDIESGGFNIATHIKSGLESLFCYYFFYGDVMRKKNMQNIQINNITQLIIH